jgi:hypothetical protein
MELEYDIHPAALVMPELSRHDFDELKADIKRHGLLSPIILIEIEDSDDLLIIDGRHRARACAELEIEPEYAVLEDWDGTPEEYVWSLNGHRRQLTESQRAACFYELIGKRAEEDAKSRKVRKPADSVLATLPGQTGVTPVCLNSRDEIAKAANVSPRTVQDAKVVAEHDPDLFIAVKQGEISASKAAKQVRAKSKPQEAPDQDEIDDRHTDRMIEHYEKIDQKSRRSRDSLRRWTDGIS